MSNEVTTIFFSIFQFISRRLDRMHSLDQFIVRVSHPLSLSFPLHSFSQLPKPGGMGKGWDRYYLFNLETKLLFYPINLGKAKKSTSVNEPAIILDMTNEEFEVSSVRSTDIYHADKRDVTSIFKVKHHLLL